MMINGAKVPYVQAKIDAEFHVKVSFFKKLYIKINH